MKAIKASTVTVNDVRLRYLAEAKEGEAKNTAARDEGKAPVKQACPARAARGGAASKPCTRDCPACDGIGWVWSDGQPAKPCPTSGVPCARPWCWACRNGARPAKEIKEIRRIFERSHARAKARAHG